MQTRWFPRAVLLAAALALLPSPGRAQALVEEALKSFPAATLRLEYSNTSNLRSLPDYSALHERYLGPRLRDLETSLANLGIGEGDVDEIVLGWKNQSQWEFYGLTAGRFDSDSIARRAAEQGIAARPVDGKPVYCFGSEQETTCAVAFDTARGAFGTLDSLKELLATRAGQGPSLATESKFAKLVEDERNEKAPIWGVALGAAVPDWFRSWMPNQGNLKLDWSQTFKSVESLTYTVEPAEKVRLDVHLGCTDSAAASNLGQVMQGLKLFQQISWQQQNPSQPNPYQDLEVATQDRQVSLSLTTDYQALESGAFGHH